MVFFGFADQDPGYAGAVCLVYAKEVAVDVNFVPRFWHAAQVAEDEATYGLEVLAFEVGAEGFVDFVYGDASVREVGAIFRLLDGWFFLVELVADLAYYLLDYVFQGEYALEGAPLVDYHGHLEVLVSEVLQDVVYVAVLGDG